MDSPTLVELVAQVSELRQELADTKAEVAELRQELAEMEQGRNWQQFRDRRAKRWTR